MKPLNISTKSSIELERFSDSEIARSLLKKLHSINESVTIMEVCGTHTMALFRTGIRDSLPSNINLVSGPGCPVCVTPVQVMEKALGLACMKNTTLFCFGDMMKVPGIKENLESAKAGRGADVRIMYSPLEAVEFAKKEPKRTVVLFGVGFETTAPLFATALARAETENIGNLYLLSEFKTIPRALDALLSLKDVEVDGFILPGHVSSIIGEDAYGFMVEKYGVPGVITGFEPIDMLEGIISLVEMIVKREPKLVNKYKRFVPSLGNPKALKKLDDVFEPSDSNWRGVGEIKGSGLKLKNEFKRFDADALINFEIAEAKDPAGCMCGDVIKGKAKPTQCPLFKKVCSPSNPVGPCMVSSEGTCAAYYKYGSRR